MECENIELGEAALAALASYLPANGKAPEDGLDPGPSSSHRRPGRCLALLALA